MNVEVRLDSTANEIKVIIITDKLSEEVDEIVQKISDTKKSSNAVSLVRQSGWQ